MTPDMFAKLKRSLIKHEGYEKFPYIDTMGKITFGIGYNATDRGIPDKFINDQFAEDANFFYGQLCQFDWFHQLTIDRQIVLIDMAFMGWKKFLTFNKMLKALLTHDYETAAKEMLDSKWAKQVKEGRAQDLANAMRTGKYEI